MVLGYLLIHILNLPRSKSPPFLDSVKTLINNIFQFHLVLEKKKFLYFHMDSHSDLILPTFRCQGKITLWATQYFHHMQTNFMLQISYSLSLNYLHMVSFWKLEACRGDDSLKEAHLSHKNIQKSNLYDFLIGTWASNHPIYRIQLLKLIQWTHPTKGD